MLKMDLQIPSSNAEGEEMASRVHTGSSGNRQTVDSANAEQNKKRENLPGVRFENTPGSNPSSYKKDIIPF